MNMSHPFKTFVFKALNSFPSHLVKFKVLAFPTWPSMADFPLPGPTLVSSHLITLGCLLFLEHLKHASTSGTLYLLFSLPEMLSPPQLHGPFLHFHQVSNERRLT